MSLKLPSFPDIRRTLAAWATELRGSGVVAVGRPRGPSLPYLPDGSKDWEQRTPATIGEGWQPFSFTPSYPASSVITSFTLANCRYQVLANMLFFNAEFTVVLNSAVYTLLKFPSPVQLKTNRLIPPNLGVTYWHAGHILNDAIPDVAWPVSGSVLSSDPNTIEIGINPPMPATNTLYFYLTFFCEVDNG